MTKCIARAGAAMRVNGVLTLLMVDQVGSTSVTSDINGALGDTVKYSAYGEVRAGGTATDYLYTSQRNEAEIGLDYYVARFYDPVTAHFIQADTIVPETGSSKAYDRYGYGGYNPINFNDPSGHEVQYINGWDPDFMYQQQGNTCGIAAATAALSVLYGRKISQQDYQWVHLHTYGFDMQIGQFAFNSGIGILPRDQTRAMNWIDPSIHASISLGSRDRLIKNVYKINLVSLICIELPGMSIGHWLTVIGYDPDANELQFYDSAYGDEISEKALVNRYDQGRSIASLEDLWGQSNSVISPYSLVTVTRSDNYAESPIGNGYPSVGRSKGGARIGDRLWNLY